MTDTTNYVNIYVSEENDWGLILNIKEMSNMKKIILLGLFAVSIFALSSTKEENQKRKEAAFKKVNNVKTTNTNKNILMERLGYYKK